MNFIKLLLVTFLYLVPVDTILAVEPDEVLTDLKLESRARDISANVRCVVCQNEPIDTSNSGVARDLRILIRERLLAGDSNKEVYKYLVDRYGNFILFKTAIISKFSDAVSSNNCSFNSDADICQSRF